MRLALWILFVGAFAALNLYGRNEGPRPDDDLVYQYSFAVGSLAGYAVLLSLVLALTVGLSRREVLALRAPASWRRSLALALGALVVIFLGAAAALSLSNAGDEQNLTPDAWDSSRAGAYALSFVAIVLVAPITEELLYRGVGLSLLLARTSVPVSVGVTALLFGLGHGLVLSLAAFVWFGDRDRAAPDPHGQHLPGLRRPLHVQRDRDDRALAPLTVTVLSMLCAARSSCSSVSPSRLRRRLRRPSSPPPPRPPRALHRCG